MNLLAFPFYNKLNSQDRFRRGCSGQGVFGQLSQANRFPPFQIKRDRTGALLDCIHVFLLDGTMYGTLLHPAFPYTLQQTQYADYITYYGGVIAGLSLPCGFYYLGIDGLFSEVFQVATDLSNTVSLSWNNSKPLGGIRYGEGFTQTLLLNSEILEPDYRFDEEGDLNGEEVFVRDLAKLSKLRVLESGGVPEYLVDAINAIPLHDDVRVGAFDDLGKLTAKTAWLKGACRGNVSVTFEDERPVLWRECDEVEEATEVSQTGFIADPNVCNGAPSVRPVWSNTGDIRCVQSEFWTSFALTQQVSKNNCLSGGLAQTTQAVAFILPEGRFESPVSQADADALALSFAVATKQAFANANGVCSGEFVSSAGAADGLDYFVNMFRSGPLFPVTITFDLIADGRPAVSRVLTIPNGVSQFGESVLGDGQPYTDMIIQITSTNPASYAFAV